MTERESRIDPPPASPPCERDPDPWDIDGIAELLHAEATPERHTQLGDGFLLRLGAGEPIAVLKLYPERSLVRYRGPVGLDLPHVAAIGPYHGALRISVRGAHGRAPLFLFPHDPAAVRLVL